MDAGEWDLPLNRVAVVWPPFQNWTRREARVLGAIVLHLDYATPLDALRARTRETLESNPRWDRQAWVLQVIDTTETTMVVRVLASARDAPTSWDLQCDIREDLLTWLQANILGRCPARGPQSTPATWCGIARCDLDPDPHALQLPLDRAPAGRQIGAVIPDECALPRPPAAAQAGQPLVGDGVALMAVGLEQVLGGGGDGLVELDLHEVADRAWISCLASQAP